MSALGGNSASCAKPKSKTLECARWLRSQAPLPWKVSVGTRNLSGSGRRDRSRVSDHSRTKPARRHYRRVGVSEDPRIKVTTMEETDEEASHSYGVALHRAALHP
jgi:hypothetical protein